MQIQISEVTLTKASKYLFLIEVNQQTKRTDLCNQYTSAPKFQQKIAFEVLDHEIVVKVCEVTVENSLKIIGTFEILLKINHNQQLNGIIYQNYNEIINQWNDNNRIIIGRCYIRVKIKQSHIQSKQQLSQKKQLEYQQQDYEIKQNCYQYSEDCMFRFHFHWGAHFYLGSSFRISVNWGINNQQCTQFQKDKINPKWVETLILQGNSSQFIQLSIQDQLKNKLQRVKFKVQCFRLMHPYHLNLHFRDQYMGDYPQIYFTLIRQEVPLFKTIQQKISLKIKNVTINNSVRYIFLMQKKQKFYMPEFISLQMKNYWNQDKINKFINQIQTLKYSWIEMIPISQESQISLLKSHLNKNLTAFVVTIKNHKDFLRNGFQQCFHIDERCDSFESTIRRVFYHNEVGYLGKQVKFMNINFKQTNDESNFISQFDQWRILSDNYALRNDLINQSIKNITIIKSNIQNKGQQLIKLKKVLLKVQQLNIKLQKKQKKMKIKNNNKQILDYSTYKIINIKQILFDRQEQLQNIKNRNKQLKQQMQKLTNIVQYHINLEGILLKNSHNILQQQNKIKKMQHMQKNIPKQLEIISKLEKNFQQKQIDKQINNSLKQQEQILRNMRKKKRINLQNILHLIKDKKQSQKNISQKIQIAQEKLSILKKQYYKLTGLSKKNIY